MVYGLHLVSNLALPELPPATETASNTSTDVQIWMGRQPAWVTSGAISVGPELDWYSSPYLDENNVPFLKVFSLGEGAYYKYVYSEGIEILLQGDGSSIWATWPENLMLEYTTIRLLGPVLGFVLSLRGITSLHASGVVIEGQVVAFVGESGAGKSTTAAAFARLGYPILTDDIVTLVEQNGEFLVQPALTFIRLWPEAVEGLYGAPDVLPRLVPDHSDWNKRYLDLLQPGYQFVREALPLAAIYLLERREGETELPPVFEELSTPTALIELVRNVFTNYLSTKAMQSRQFQLVGRLVKQVPIRKLTFDSDMSRLNQVCKAVQADFDSQVSNKI